MEYNTIKKTEQMYLSLVDKVLSGEKNEEDFSKGMTSIFSTLGYGTENPADLEYVSGFLAPFLSDASKAISLRKKNPREFIGAFAKAEPQVHTAFIGRALMQLPQPTDDGSDLYKGWNKQLEQLVKGASADYWYKKIRQELGADQNGDGDDE